MDIYHGFFNLKPGTGDMEFACDLGEFMEFLVTRKKIRSWRLMRRKLGLGPQEIGEFHLMIEVRDMAELDDAFNLVATRSGETEQKHFAVNSKIADVKFALYRDFPDPVRRSGDELF